MENLMKLTEGFVDRHVIALPNKVCNIKVLTKDFDGYHIFLCKWIPFDKSKYSEIDMPPDSYLGTATVIEGQYAGIGFHAWIPNDSEFVWYKVIED